MLRLSAAKAMRERSQDSQAGLTLYVGLFGHLGMLHRTKYSRFRNESITSLDEGSPGGSVGNKGSSPPPYAALTPHLPAEDATVPNQESPTALCTLIPRMASMKLANPVTFLSLKTFCLGSKQVPRLKLQENQDQTPSSPASPETSLNSTGPAPTPLRTRWDAGPPPCVLILAHCLGLENQTLGASRMDLLCSTCWGTVSTTV